MNAGAENSPPVKAAAPGDASALSPAPSSVLRIPDHELLRRIGGGSYGEVWLASNAMGAYRAVKVVYRRSFEHERPYQREFAGIQRFEPISRSHQGLMDILQVGRNDAAGYFYYVMELADDVGAERSDGVMECRSDAENPSALNPTTPSLHHSIAPFPPDPDSYAPKTLKSEIYRRGRLPLEECLGLGLRLADALSYLHKQGLVHRDIKPSNIIFVQGVPKLADIGLVAEVGQTISFVGTEGFIPPEGPGTPQADLYSLGKVLYEISTGKDRQDYPDPPTNFADSNDNHGLLEFNEVVFNACASDVRKRYQSAEEMHHELALVRSGHSLKRLRAVERRLALATKVGAGILVLTILAGTAYLQASRAERTATHRLVRLNVANAVRSMDDGDFFGALPWIAEAIRLAKGDSSEEEMHRYRFEAVLRACPKLSALCAHEQRIYHAAFSPDGRRSVTASADHTARVWDTSTGQLLLPPLKHEDDVRKAAFSPDGRRIVTYSHEGMMRIWDAATGQQVCPGIQHSLEPRSIAFSPDSQRIVTSSGAHSISEEEIVQRIFPNGQRVVVPHSPGETVGQAQVWDAATGQPIGPALRHAAAVHQARFSPDGQKIVTVSDDQTAVIWDASTGQAIAPPLKHGAKVRQAVFSPDGRLVLTASEDGTAQLWDAATGRLLGSPLRHAKGVLHAAFSPDGRKIVTTSRDQTACLWDALSGQLLCLPLRHDNDVWHAEFSPDGQRLLTAGSEPVVRVWDAASGQLLAPLPHNNSGTYATFSPDGRQVLSVSRDPIARLWDLSPLSPGSLRLEHHDEVHNAEFSRDGTRVLTASADQVARAWDTATARPVTPWLHDPATDRNAHFAAKFSPNGRLVVTAGSFRARIYDAAQGHLECFLPNGTNWVRCATFSPDSQRVVTASQDHTARVWNALTGQPISPALQHPSPVWDAAFSPDGRRLATVCGNYDDSRTTAARVWDATTGQPLSPPIKLPGGTGHARFSPDGQRLLTTSASVPQEELEARVWDWRTGRPAAPPLRHADGVPWAEFSPDGHRVLTASFDKTARIWDAKSGRPLTPALKHDRQVEHAAFSPDGRRVVTACGDGAARVWDAATGERLTPPLKHQGSVLWAEFSPDGRRVITASQDHTARVWDLPKTERPLADLLLLAGLLSGQHIDGTGGLAPLPAEELMSAWRTLRAKYPAQFALGSN